MFDGEKLRSGLKFIMIYFGDDWRPEFVEQKMKITKRAYILLGNGLDFFMELQIS